MPLTSTCEGQRLGSVSRRSLLATAEFFRLRKSSNDAAIRDDGSLRDHDNAIPNVERGCIEVAVIAGILDNDIVSDSNVSVDDRVCNENILPDPNVWNSLEAILIHFLERLIFAGTDDVGMTDRRALFNACAAPNDGMTDLRAFQETSVGNDAMVHMTIVDPGGRQTSRPGENGIRDVIEVELRHVRSEV